MASHCAFLALVGRPNTGKSSLLNRLVGQKVAIVSPKPQTTRNRIMGVLTEGENQYVFLDTPGLHRPRTKLGDYMVRTVSDTVGSVDAAVLVADAAAAVRSGSGEIPQEEIRLLAQIGRNRLPCVLVLNKTDLIADKESLLAVIARYTARHDFAAVVPLSALTGEGISDLKEELLPFAGEGPHYFPDDAVSDQPERVLASELVREQILKVMRDEVPHGVAVVTERWEESVSAGEPVIHIGCVIYCERESHKGMLIGKGGARLKEVGSGARAELEKMLSAKVDLKTWVKVKEDWRNRPGALSGFGYSR